MSSFHCDFILSKRSSLAKVWLAAHWEKKLSKVQIFESNLQAIAQDIIHPNMPIALRISSHLLVGLVRIYSRKAQYLLKDCSDTLVNIKVAFRPGTIDLMKKEKQRKSTSKDYMECSLFITETVDLLDQWIPEVSNLEEMDCTLNQSKRDDITLCEEPMKLNSLEDFYDDEGFGEMDAEGSDTLERSLCTSSSALERVGSFADSAYGTDDQAPAETLSNTDYYSDPFSSGLTPVKEFTNSSPCNTTREQLPKLFLDDGGESSRLEDPLSSPCRRNPGDILSGDEYDAYTSTSETFGETEQNATDDEDDTNNVVESGSETTQGLKRILDDGDEDRVLLDPIEDWGRKSPRKKLKVRLLIDVETSLDRDVIVDNISHPDRSISEAKLACRSRSLMVQYERSRTLFGNRPGRVIAPVLEKLFTDCNRRKPSASGVDESDGWKKPVEQVENDFKTASSRPVETGLDNGAGLSVEENQSDGFVASSEPDGPDLSDEFIPLQDEEYLSDDEESFPAPNDDNEEGFLGNNTFDAGASTSKDGGGEGEILDENILKDGFCSFVETSILNGPARCGTFRQFVGADGYKVTRKMVARRFLKCLLMQRDSRLSMKQDESFGEITLAPGPIH